MQPGDGWLSFESTHALGGSWVFEGGPSSRLIVEASDWF